MSGLESSNIGLLCLHMLSLTSKCYNHVGLIVHFILGIRTGLCLNISPLKIML